MAEHEVLETGIWLVREERGRGVGTAAVSAVLRQARDLGAIEVRADTGADDAAALKALRRLGFRLVAGDDRRTKAAVSIDPLHATRKRIPFRASARWRGPAGRPA